ncbi:hypothetical protein GCM10011375_34690 [Hymenobacter qilianensis]|nr:hypothetical protein GCM10011375_34690 [Hymenobacter qilianensis]
MTLYRRIIFAFILTVAVSSASAQSTNTSSPGTLQLGVGTAMMGTGDYKMLKAHLEYEMPFLGYFGSGTRLAFAGGSSEERIQTVYNPQKPGSTGVNVPLSQSYHTANLEHEFYLYPFGNDRQARFFVGGGGYVGYSNRYGYPQNHIDFATNETSLDLDHEKGVHAGYMFSLNFDVRLGQTQDWLIGGKTSFQNDTFGNSLLALQFKVGRRF